MLSITKIFKYLWPLFKKYQWPFYVAILLFIFRTAVDFVAIPVFFKELIDTISAPGGDRAALQGELMRLVALIIGLHFAVALTARVRQILLNKFTVNMVKSIRDYTFQKIEQNSYTFFTNTFTGSLVTKARRFPYAFEGALEVGIFEFLNTATVFVSIFIVLSRESLLICGIFFGIVAVYLFVISFFIRKKSKYDVLEAEQDSKISGRFSDVFSNIMAVKFFSARNREIESFDAYTKEAARRSTKTLSVFTQIEIIQTSFTVIMQSVMLYIMIRMWLNGQVSTGMVVLVQTYTVLMLSRVWGFINSLTRFMKSLSDMKETIDIFEIVPDILDPKDPEISRMKEGNIVFENVSFKYALGREVISNLNFEVKPGERVGIVGHSGAGKSTITKLLLRLNDVSDGRITIDGQDIRNVTQEELRNAISYVPQEPILFHRSVKENINYGKPDATMDIIMEVSKKAHAHEFVTALPNGYDTLVGERGVKLSGGERQRVAIARALLKQAPVLVLDEATSSLDSISESYIQESLGELMKGKTSIVIAHRLSTIQKMDRIIVLEKGKIVEDGNHQDLLKRGGLYAELWNHQSGGFLKE